MQIVLLYTSRLHEKIYDISEWLKKYIYMYIFYPYNDGLYNYLQKKSSFVMHFRRRHIEKLYSNILAWSAACFNDLHLLVVFVCLLLVFRAIEWICLSMISWTRIKDLCELQSTGCHFRQRSTVYPCSSTLRDLWLSCFI